MRSLDSDPDGPDPIANAAYRLGVEANRRDFEDWVEARVAGGRFYASREPSIKELLDDIPRL